MKYQGIIDRFFCKQILKNIDIINSEDVSSSLDVRSHRQSMLLANKFHFLNLH
jgi:hypothetical protein